MFEGSLGITFVILTILVLLSLPFVNRIYKKRASDYFDELLRANPSEYAKQIKGNAYRYLVGKSIWGVLLIICLFYSFNHIVENNLYGIAFFWLVLGIGMILWGIFSFKRELGKLQNFR